MNPLDLSGPGFLGLYLLLLPCALALRAWMRRRCASNAPAVGRLPRLSVYEMALLVGGRERAVGTALAKLARDGAIGNSGPGQLAVQAPWPAGGEAGDALVAEVYRALETRPQSWQHMAGRRFPALNQAEARLQADGLLTLKDSPSARCHRFATLAPVWGLFAFGAAKFAVGLWRDRPVGLLFLLLAVTAGIALTSPGLPRLSARGTGVVDLLRKRNAALQSTALRRGADLSEADLMLAMAVFGSAVLAVGPLAWVHLTLVPPTRPGDHARHGDGGSGGGSDGGSDGGGGSGCGGGGCGGGCGGCGS